MASLVTLTRNGKLSLKHLLQAELSSLKRAPHLLNSSGMEPTTSELTWINTLLRLRTGSTSAFSRRVTPSRNSSSTMTATSTALPTNQLAGMSLEQSSLKKQTALLRPSNSKKKFSPSATIFRLTGMPSHGKKPLTTTPTPSAPPHVSATRTEPSSMT